MEATVDALRQRRDRSLDANLVELRLDGLANGGAARDLEAALAGRTRPVIVTCRPTWEGGRYDGDERDRLAVLRRALDLGAEYVDLEWRIAESSGLLTGATRERVVLSMHDFDGVPPDLADRIADMRRLRPAVVKAAVRIDRLRELVALLEIGRMAGAERTVLIGMGMPGIVSRLLPNRFGSCWTYTGDEVAPGQVRTSRLLHEFRLQAVSDGAPVFAVVGNPVAHSVSPAMHNAGFDALGIDAVYVPCQAADWDDFVAFAEALPIAGASVTAPFKEDAWAHVAGTRTAAASGPARDLGAGAVNTLKRVGNAWEGCNTDRDGFLAPLLERCDLAGQRVAVLGAGGAARSVVWGLRSQGAAVTISARRRDAAEALALEIGGEVGPWPPAPGTWDILVNTTPVGTYPDVDATPLAPELLTGSLVYDLVYNPLPTRLLRDAAEAECQTIDGLEMLVQQARRQFAWWHGAMPSADLFRQAAVRRLGEMAQAGTS